MTTNITRLSDESENLPLLVKPALPISFTQESVPLIAEIASNLQTALYSEISPEHKTPAYLAANQLGYKYQMLAFHHLEEGTPALVIMVNPRIVSISDELQDSARINTFSAPQFRVEISVPQS